MIKTSGPVVFNLAIYPRGSSSIVRRDASNQYSKSCNKKPLRVLERLHILDRACISNTYKCIELLGRDGPVLIDSFLMANGVSPSKPNLLLSSVILARSRHSRRWVGGMKQRGIWGLHIAYYDGWINISRPIDLEVNELPLVTCLSHEEDRKCLKRHRPLEYFNSKNLSPNIHNLIRFPYHNFAITLLIQDLAPSGER